MVKMSDVATRAGVSQATVSFVLGGQSESLKISAQTRQHVLNVAREMGYQRNQLARAMITGKSRILGVLNSPAFGENIVHILAGAAEAVSSNDYFLKVIHLSHAGVDDATITRCLEWRLAGAMVVGLNEQSTQRISQEFASKQLPLVLIDNAPTLEWGIHIHSNDEQGIHLVVSHLVSLGHRRIALLNGRPSHVSAWRETSFRAALAKHGLSVPEHWMPYSSWSDQDIIEKAARPLLLESKDCRPTAIVCSADSIAMVVQRIARFQGLRLPEDLSITGYSNASLSSFTDPPLTTVDQSFHAMGYSAALHLIENTRKDKPAENDVPQSDFLIPTQLRIRQSTTTAPLP